MPVEVHKNELIYPGNEYLQRKSDILTPRDQMSDNTNFVTT